MQHLQVAGHGDLEGGGGGGEGNLAAFHPAGGGHDSPRTQVSWITF